MTQPTYSNTYQTDFEPLQVRHILLLHTLSGFDAIFGEICLPRHCQWDFFLGGFFQRG